MRSEMPVTRENEAADTSEDSTELEHTHGETGIDLMYLERLGGDYLGLQKGRAATFSATTRRMRDLQSTQQQKSPLPPKSNKKRNLKQKENKQYPSRFYARGGRLSEN